MAKSSGLGAALFIDGYDVTDDYGSVTTLSKAMDVIDQTGLRKTGFQRVSGKLHGEMTGMAFFNPTNAHVLLSDRTRNDRVASYYHRETLAAPVASLTAKQMNYDPKRDMAGGLTADVQLLSNQWWLDWGLACTAGARTDTTGTSGTGVDFASQGAPASFGLQAHLHVFSFTGTNVTIKLQGSSDDAVGDPYADITGGAFTVVSAAPTKEAIRTARNLAVERWVRVVTTGTFSSVAFAVAVTVNATEMTI